MEDPVTEKAPRRFKLPARLPLIAGAAAALAIGGTAGVVAQRAIGPTVEMAPLRPVPIRSLASDSGIVTVRGRVADIFGNKFVVDDGSGRALIDTGPEGEDRALASAGAPVTVQGQFDRGMLRASFLVDAAGKVTALGPVGGPPPRPGGPGGPAGPRMGPPPPPPGAAPPPPPPGMAPPPPPVPGVADAGAPPPPPPGAVPPAPPTTAATGATPPPPPAATTPAAAPAK